MKKRAGNVRRQRPAPMRQKLCSALLLAMVTCTAPAWAQRNDAPQDYSISAGDLAGALDQLASQSKVQIIYPAELVRGKRVAPVSGQQSWREALHKLLAGTDLTYGFVNDTTVVIRRSEPAATAPAASGAGQRSRTSSEDSAPVTNMPEMLVRGARSLNADIQRTINDPQPYVVFEREEIERSGAINLDDFMLRRVSANAANAPSTQSGAVSGDLSGINLRGLGVGQTLVLIDGRRVAPAYPGFTVGQTNLNNIPLAAVERIEILPTTASAIYGGSATGGVINVILRRDYKGGEVAVSYDDSFDTDSSISRIDFSYGFNLGEKTTVLLNGSYAETNLLLKRDRDFRMRGFERIFRNDPSFLLTSLHQSTSPNIVSSSGADLILLDGTSLDSPITYAPKGYLGAGSDGGAALVANAGRLNNENDHSGWFYNGGSSFGAVPRTYSLSASFRHHFSDWLDGFLDLSANDNQSRSIGGAFVRFSVPAGHEFNPFQQAINVAVPSDEFVGINRQLNKSQRASVGLIARLGETWAGSLDFTWSKSTNLFQQDLSGTIDGAAAMVDGFNPLVDYYNLGGRTLRPYLSGGSTMAGPSSAYSYNPTLRFSGPLWALPAGPVSASFLLEQQRIELAPRTNHNFPGAPNELFISYPERSQDLRSAYAELTIPLFGKENGRTGIHALDVQLAARYDDYDTVSGNSVRWSPEQVQPEQVMVSNSVAESTGLLGLKYAPFVGLTFRASHGTGFVPPSVIQLDAPLSGPVLHNLPDTRRGNTLNPMPYVSVSGGNPGLNPERSRTTSFGVIVEPERLPTFRASLDYTWLRKTDNITTLSHALLLEYEDRFPDRVRRGPNLPTDEAGWAGPITYMDVSSINAASAEYEALDAQLKYGINLANGTYVELWGNGTWTLKAKQQAVSGGPSNNLRGISASSGTVSALNFRGFYGANVEKHGWAAGWVVRHYSSYLAADPELGGAARILSAQGNGGRVPRQVLHDVWGRWRFTHEASRGSDLHSFLSNLEISGGIRNLFNTRPEVDLSNAFYFYSYLVDPRLRTYYVQLKYTF